MSGVRERFRSERARRPWLDHLARAGSDYRAKNGDHMAAAVTYFSFLALFPLILVGFAVLGLVLQGNHELLVDIQNQVNKSAPAGLGGDNGPLNKAMSSAAEHWRAVGIIGLLGALYAGLGWIGNLRTAIQAIWEFEPKKENFFVTKAHDLLALIGLGVAVLVSLTITGLGTGATHQLISWAGLGNVPGVGTATWIIGIGIAIAADVLIFGWMFVRLPRSPLTMRAVFRGALLAAVGFEILKLVGTYYIAQIGRSPAAGVFGSVLGLLVFIYLVCRLLLFATAWTASSPSIRALHKKDSDDTPDSGGSAIAEKPSAAAADTAVPKATSARHSTAVRTAPNGAAVAAALVGLGMASGATLARLGLRRSAR